MIRGQRRLAAWMLVAGLSAAVPGPAQGQDHAAAFAGRLLQDVLRDLRAAGLRLAFSSELVTPSLRVLREPRSADAESQLKEILEPHGLEINKGPGGILQVIRARRPPPPRTTSSWSEPAEVPNRPDVDSGLPGPITERVVVTAPNDANRQGRSATARVLEGLELRAGSAALVNDPLRLVGALPGVVAGDDYRGELSIRGSPYRHTALVVDEVATSWLTHTAPGRGLSSSLSMLRGDVLEQATLERGAYARRYGDRLGAQVSFSLREGSRSAARFEGSASGTNTAVTGEGPLGGAARGSWLVAARHSHVEWPLGRDDHETTVFGFADMQSKLVFDLSPTQQIGATLVAGRSGLQRDTSDVLAIADGASAAALLSVYSRSLVRPGVVVRQRASLVTRAFDNRNGRAEVVDAGHQRDLGYRLEASAGVPIGLVDAGVEIRRLRGSRDEIAPQPAALSWWTRAAYAHLRVPVARRFVVSPGVRLSGSTLATRAAVDPWLAAEWHVAPRWTVHGSSGVAHQFATFEDRMPWAIASRFDPERAVHGDVGVRGAVGSLGWDLTAFARRERDVIRDADTLWIGDRSVMDLTSPLERVSGSARGIEIRLEQPRSLGLSWSSSYFYSRADYGSAGGARFAADLDQRHAVTAAAFYRRSDGLIAHALLRTGSGVPIPGRVSVQDGGFSAEGDPNQVRLPTYARLDLRVERTLSTAGRRRLTPFFEVINVLNRSNVGVARSVTRLPTGQAVGVTERLYPRLITAGLRIEF